MMFSVGISQGLFNLGLMLTGYTQPQQIGVNAEGILLYADQPIAAVNWINMAYQGTYIIILVRISDTSRTITKMIQYLLFRQAFNCSIMGASFLTVRRQWALEL